MDKTSGDRPEGAEGRPGSTPYDPMSKALHWATAALVLASFVLAIWPGLVQGSAVLHRSLGLLLLFLVPLRLAWRLARGTGGGAAESDGLAALAARAVHGTLYLTLVALPLLGWLYMDLKGTGASIFGHALPTLAGTDRELAALVFRAKWWIAYGMLATIGLHAAAALAHHYLLRDGILAGMLPEFRLPRRRAQPRPGLAAPLSPAARR